MISRSPALQFDEEAPAMTLRNRSRPRRDMAPVHSHAVAVDIGATLHVAAVSPRCDPEPVRSFGSFTTDLHRLADWLAVPGQDGGDGVDLRLLLGFKRSSQHLDGGGCDEGWETALGSGTTSRGAAVARPTRRGAA